MPCYATRLILLISWLFLVSSVRDAVCTSGEIAVLCYTARLILLISCLFLVTRRCNRPFACYAPRLVLSDRVPCYEPSQSSVRDAIWTSEEIAVPCYAVRLILLISCLFLVTRRCISQSACYAPSSVRDAVCSSGEIAVPCYAESQILLISCQFLVVRRCNRLFACYAPRLVLLISCLFVPCYAPVQS